MDLFIYILVLLFLIAWCVYAFWTYTSAWQLSNDLLLATTTTNAFTATTYKDFVNFFADFTSSLQTARWFGIALIIILIIGGIIYWYMAPKYLKKSEAEKMFAALKTGAGDGAAPAPKMKKRQKDDGAEVISSKPQKAMSADGEMMTCYPMKRSQRQSEMERLSAAAADEE